MMCLTGFCISTEWRLKDMRYDEKITNKPSMPPSLIVWFIWGCCIPKFNLQIITHIRVLWFGSIILNNQPFIVWPCGQCNGRINCRRILSYCLCDGNSLLVYGRYIIVIRASKWQYRLCRITVIPCRISCVWLARNTQGIPKRCIPPNCAGILEICRYPFWQVIFIEQIPTWLVIRVLVDDGPKGATITLICTFKFCCWGCR